MNPKYMYDSYLKEYNSTALEIDSNKIVLRDTIFYPSSGGQPTDKGHFMCGDDRYEVINVKKENGKIVHEVDKEGIKEKDDIVMHLDWDRRYKLMRYHTATHVLCSVFHNEGKALITGNQLDLEQTRIDFNLEEFDREKIDVYVKMANEVLKKNLQVRSYFLMREEAMKIQGIVKLAAALPPQIDELRIVEIGDFDIQADGGTHVNNTLEVGEIEIVKCENKGKSNRRVYFRLK
jgi:Ser-tRNA(Ala) deacylase AlaX